jgi:hypothetical protein
MQLSESRRLGWLSKRWMVPYRYRIPLFLALLVIGYFGFRVATDASDPLLPAAASTVPLMALADYLWWRRHRRR